MQTALIFALPFLAFGCAGTREAPPPQSMPAPTAARVLRKDEASREEQKQRWRRAFSEIDHLLEPHAWDLTKNASNICEAHGCEMKVEIVSVFRGLPIDNGELRLRLLAKDEEEMPAAPHIRQNIMGCITNDVHSARIYVCYQCTSALADFNDRRRQRIDNLWKATEPSGRR